MLRRNSAVLTGLVAIGLVLGPIDQAMAARVAAPADPGPAPTAGGHASTDAPPTPVERSPGPASLRPPEPTPAALSPSTPARSSPDPTPDTGLDLLVWGVVLAALVGPSLTAAAAVHYDRLQDLSSYNRTLDESTYIVPLYNRAINGSIDIAIMSFGIAGTVTGIPLLTVGAIRFNQHRRWRQTRTARLIPGLGRTSLGTTTVTLQVRF